MNPLAEAAKRKVRSAMRRATRQHRIEIRYWRVACVALVAAGVAMACRRLDVSVVAWSFFLAFDLKCRAANRRWQTRVTVAARWRGRFEILVMATLLGRAPGKLRRGDHRGQPN